jgi:multidrug resistance protein, MATE family
MNNKPGSVQELMHIALPMMVSSACETVMMFIDRLFLSHLSVDHMSASMGGGITQFMMLSFFFGVVGYSSPLVAQYCGSNQKHKCSAVTVQTVMFAFMAYPVLLMLIPVGAMMFSGIGLPPKQLALQHSYYSILMWGSLPALLRNALSAFHSGVGHTRPVMRAALAALVVNTIVNYVLIFGNWGAPALGIEGAAYGTILGSSVAVVLLVINYFGPAMRAQYQTHRIRFLQWEYIKKLLRYGSPSGLEFLLGILAFNLVVLIFHSYGGSVSAAVTIAFNWDMVSFIPMLGINIGVGSLVGKYMGMRRPRYAHNSTMAGLRITMIYSLIVLVVFLGFTHELVSVFLSTVQDDGQTYDLAVFMVRMVSIYLLADALFSVFTGALKGAGDTMAVMLISTLWHWGFAIVTWILVKHAQWSPYHSWTVLVFMVCAMGLSLYLRYRQGKWMRLQVV